MTSMPHSLRTVAMAAGTVLVAMTASAQPAGDPHAQGHQDHAAAAPSRGGAAGMAGMSRAVMARLTVLDERIRTLAVDMEMFTGELKVETMAALLTALVERQSLMGLEMPADARGNDAPHDATQRRTSRFDRRGARDHVRTIALRPSGEQ